MIRGMTNLWYKPDGLHLSSNSALLKPRDPLSMKCNYMECHQNIISHESK